MVGGKPDPKPSAGDRARIETTEASSVEYGQLGFWRTDCTAAAFKPLQG